jgi:uncharacterized protein YigE (DUF2233 family)
MKKYFVLFAVLLFFSCSNNNPETSSHAKKIDSDSIKAAIKKADLSKWAEIDTGLFFREFDSPVKSSAGDSKIYILKINPAHYNFTLCSAKENMIENKTAKAWANQKKFIAVINAGMFLSDGKTNTGFMKNFDFVNNDKLSSDNSIIAFNRKDNSVPEFQLIDRECQDWEKLKDKYNSFSQGIRMIDCKQNNKWEQQNKKWSMVSIGTDKQGNVLFIFTRSPYSVHDFIDILLKLPIEIKNAQYLEGGPEASLFVHDNSTTIEKFGSYETGFNENDGNDTFWDLPNVIGITKK